MSKLEEYISTMGWHLQSLALILAAGSLNELRDWLETLLEPQFRLAREEQILADEAWKELYPHYSQAGRGNSDSTKSRYILYQIQKNVPARHSVEQRMPRYHLGKLRQKAPFTGPPAIPDTRNSYNVCEIASVRGQIQHHDLLAKLFGIVCWVDCHLRYRDGIRDFVITIDIPLHHLTEEFVHTIPEGGIRGTYLNYYEAPTSIRDRDDRERFVEQAGILLMMILPATTELVSTLESAERLGLEKSFKLQTPQFRQALVRLLGERGIDLKDLELTSWPHRRVADRWFIQE